MWEKELAIECSRGGGGSFDSGTQGIGSAQGAQGAQGRTGDFSSVEPDVGLMGAWSDIVPIWRVEISQ